MHILYKTSETVLWSVDKSLLKKKKSPNYNHTIDRAGNDDNGNCCIILLSGQHYRASISLADVSKVLKLSPATL